MKKLLTLLLCALTFAISAQNNTGVLVMQTNAQLPVTASVDVPVQVKTTTDANTAKPSPNAKGKKGYKFRDRPVMYILAGVFIVLVVTLTIVTGGQGINSRS
jgi:hypothetical protein